MSCSFYEKYDLVGFFLPCSFPPSHVNIIQAPIVCWCCHKTCLAVWLINSHEKTAQFSGRPSGQPRSRSQLRRPEVTSVHTVTAASVEDGCSGLWLVERWQSGLLLVSVGGQLMSDPLNNMRDKRTGHTIPRLWLNLIFNINMSATCQQDGWRYTSFSLILRKHFSIKRGQRSNTMAAYRPCCSLHLAFNL